MVEYIDRQAKVKNDPLFGDIQELTAASVAKKSKTPDLKYKIVPKEVVSSQVSVRSRRNKVR